MADEAFALSPISARAALPSEEDYAAISEAFMETSRGRWFLTEYAKRNRNADTRMVLDAVARIEQSLAAQKDESLAAQREAAAAAAAADTSLNEAKLAEARLAEARLTEARLAEAMAAIRNAIEAAQASAVEALDGLALNERLAPVRKGARVLREIAWRLREIGNDGRICDLIDSQVSVIEKGAEQISSDEAKNEAGPRSAPPSPRSRGGWRISAAKRRLLRSPRRSNRNPCRKSLRLRPAPFRPTLWPLLPKRASRQRTPGRRKWKAPKRSSSPLKPPTPMTRPCST